MSNIPSAGSIALRLMSMEVARRTHDREVTPEHLFVAICELAIRPDEDLVREGQRLELNPSNLERLRWERRILRKALQDSGATPRQLASDLLAVLGQGPDLQRQTRTYHRNEACREIYRTADRLARTTGSLGVEPLHLLWALLTTDNNRVGPFLRQQGVDILALTGTCERLNQQSFTPAQLVTRAGPSKSAFAPNASAPSAAETHSTTPLLDKIGKDLTARAHNGELPKLVGMEPLVLQICRGLLRMDKGAVLLLGEPGVGKTAAVEAFAQAIVQGTLPGVLTQRLGTTRVIEVPLGALVAGTSLRGQFEERVQNLLDEARQNLDSVVLFIDEIHLMMGAGSTQQGGMDVGNLLKPAMSRGEVRLIGATTPDECARYLEPDQAIMRRWERVFVEEADPETTLKILRELRGPLQRHYRLKIPDESLRAAVNDAQRYIHDRRQPARSLDVLHEACAHMMCMHSAEEHWKDPTWTTPSPARLELPRRAVAEIVARRCKLPVSRILAQDNRLAAQVRRALEARIIGQPGAIDAVMNTITRAAQGLTDPQRPDGVFVLAGSGGTGKTELAQTVAQAMFGQRAERLVTLDMAEFAQEHRAALLVGAPAGYSGHEQGGALTEPVRQAPHSVLLLDNIERAHPNAIKLLTQICDQGAIQDSHGRRVDFTHTLIFATTTLQAPSTQGRMGIGASDAAEDTQAVLRQLERQAKRTLPAALLQRADKLVLFEPLSAPALRQVADNLLEQWRARLKERGAALSLTEGAYQRIIALCEAQEHGAHLLRRVIEQGVIQAIADHGLQNAHFQVDVGEDGDFKAHPLMEDA